MFDHLIVPCAGRGSRFQAVTDIPKFLIPIAGRPMIDWALCSAESDYRYRCLWIIIHKDQLARFTYLGLGSLEDLQSFLSVLLHRIAEKVMVIVQETPLSGAASSVLTLKERIPARQSVAIWNCDQYVIDWPRNKLEKEADGWVLTFVDPTKNPKWSYVEIAPTGWAQRLVEKEAISTEATVGAYMFKTARDLFWSIEEEISYGTRTNNEWYLAPCYNQLIKLGRVIDPVRITGEMEGLGTPEDCDKFVRNHKLPDWRPTAAKVKI